MAIIGENSGKMRKNTSLNLNESPKCTKLLLENGANPNAFDKINFTPLHAACKAGEARCIDILI
jgi:ankyrin repeat protein